MLFAFSLVDICTHGTKEIEVPNSTSSHCILYHPALSVTTPTRKQNKTKYPKNHFHVRMSFVKQSIWLTLLNLDYLVHSFLIFCDKWKVHQALLYTKVQWLPWGKALDLIVWVPSSTSHFFIEHSFYLKEQPTDKLCLFRFG